MIQAPGFFRLHQLCTIQSVHILRTFLILLSKIKWIFRSQRKIKEINLGNCTNGLIFIFISRRKLLFNYTNYSMKVWKWTFLHLLRYWQKLSIRFKDLDISSKRYISAWSMKYPLVTKHLRSEISQFRVK